MLVGHVARFGHGRGNLDGVAEHVDIFVDFGLESEEVHVTPALVGGGQPSVDSNGARPHGGDHVEHVSLQAIAELKLQRVRRCVHIDQRVFGPVLQNALVAFCPGLLEQRSFGRHVVVGIQHQHLAFGFGFAEIVGNLAGALIGPGRAAVGRQRNAQGIDTTIRHGL